MTELLRIYEELYSVKQEYCVICLRSGQERRMVAIKNLELFVKSINLPFTYQSDFQRVCWACERAAAAAYRLRLAVNLSSSVHSLFSLMDRSVLRRRDVAIQLRGETQPVGIVQQAFEWQKKLKEVRARSTLLHTEVLVVASVPPSNMRDMTSRPSSPPDESNVYLIPDDAPPPAPSPAQPHRRPPTPAPMDAALCEPEIFMDSVIIEDDERDPIEIKHEESTLEEVSTPRRTPAPHPVPPLLATIPKPNPSVVSLEKLLEDKGNTSFLLHPIVENNGVMSVPSLNAQIINGQLMTVDKSNLVIQTPKLALHNGVNFNLVTEPNRVSTFLKSMNKNDLCKASVVSDNIPFQVLKKNIEHMRVNVPPLGLNDSRIAARQDLLTLMTGTAFQNDNVITHSIIIDDEDGTGNEASGDTENAAMRQGDTDSGRRKRDRDKQSDGPPKKQRETDWEDKIPMDVISYMGATDPNADALLTREPPLGVISAVQSVTEEAHSGLNSVQSDDTHILGTNGVQTGINSVHSGINSVHSGINSANSGIKSVQFILSSVPTQSSSGNHTSNKGVQRAGRGTDSVHQNVFSNNEANKRMVNKKTNEVIDLC